MLRKLTKEEGIKYKKQIESSRKKADSYVFGYKKKEMIDEEEMSIKTLAKGEEGWVNVSNCSFKDE